MREKRLRGVQESDGVRQLRMRVKGSFIHPLGMNAKYELSSKLFAARSGKAWSEKSVRHRCCVDAG